MFSESAALLPTARSIGLSSFIDNCNGLVNQCKRRVLRAITGIAPAGYAHKEHVYITSSVWY